MAAGDTTYGEGPARREPAATDSPPQTTAGLSWCWEMDLAAVLDAVTGVAPWLREPHPRDEQAAGQATEPAPAAKGSAGPSPTASRSPKPAAPSPAAEAADMEADEAAYQEAVAAGRASDVPLDVVAGRVAEALPTGPGLAGWLAQARAVDLEDGALAGVAASFRRVASWAAAGELAAVAQIASRSAKADRRASVDHAGRPDRLTGDAVGQVALALALSPDGASSWTDLAVVLTWRLRATIEALAAGQIDLARAKMIARMTAGLDDEAARAVEAEVLGRAGWLTLGQLHDALRRAVIRADPDGAERRRERAERNAQVVLYPEDEGTATLAGYSLPGVPAAAAMARITALAKALQAANVAGGAGTGIDLIRAQVFLGLLLGTLPNIPPAPGAPPDPTPTDEPPDDGPPGSGSPDGGLPDDCPPHAGAEGGPPARDWMPDDLPPDDQPPDDLPPDDQPRDDRLGHEPSDAMSGNWPMDEPEPTGPTEPTGPPWWPGVPPFLADRPGEPAGLTSLAGTGGALSLTVPFGTLTGSAAAAGQLSRLGVITPQQARHLADLAAANPATRWRIVITNAAGEAIAVTHLPRSRGSGGPPGPAPQNPGPVAARASPGPGLVGRVTLVVAASEARAGPGRPPPPPEPTAPRTRLDAILNRALTASALAVADADERARNDVRAGRCAHDLATAAYRPPPRIADLVTARDGTCRFRCCRRPAEQCDLDHTVPYDQGGLTCTCNIGGGCRTHHILKQHPRWTLTQPEPGVFRWTTPSGRTYVVPPDPYC